MDNMSKAAYRLRVNAETVRSIEANPVSAVVLFVLSYWGVTGLFSWVNFLDPRLLGLAALPLLLLAIRRKSKKVVDFQIRMAEAHKREIDDISDDPWL